MKSINTIIVLLFLLVMPLSLLAQSAKVLQLNIKNDIDPRMSRYLELGLEHASEGEYDLVVIEMDTYGGLVTDAMDMVEMLLGMEQPVYVFIDKDAASAGALISIACDSIYMAPGSRIGAATVVMGQGEAAPDKYQSYMRSTMRSTAEENGRDPAIAEAMVDERIEIEGVTKEGEVLTFTTSEAIKHGFCEAELNSIEEVIERSGYSDYVLEEYELNATEKVIAIFLNPIISGLLIMIIVGGIWFELQSPGIGFPIAAAVVAAILYFVPYYLNGLAANWELLVFVVGIILIGIELVAVPGFGFIGGAGIILTVASLILVMLGNDVFDFSMVPFERIFAASTATLGGIVGSFLILFLGGVKFTQTRFFQRAALTAVQASAEGYTSKFEKKQMVGTTGVAYTVLRPSGKVLIDNEVYDAFTRGDFIDRNDPIEVISDEGTSLQVKNIKQS